MHYENPQLPEGINNSDRRPLLSFFGLAGGAVAVVAALAAVLFFLASRLTPLIPFQHEVVLARSIVPGGGPAEGVIETYLRGLAARLAEAQELPDGMTIQLHYNDAAVVNAFATLGGHVVIFRGLLEAMPDENALAMVVAHEIAHVRHRHPIASLGRAAALGLALTLAGADSASRLVDSAVAQGGSLTMLSFSRAQEEEADATALETLQRAYGHVAGADRFFRLMLERADSRQPPRFLSSHPLTAQRIRALETLALQRGWSSHGALTPLPAEVRAELQRQQH